MEDIARATSFPFTPPQLGSIATSIYAAIRYRMAFVEQNNAYKTVTELSTTQGMLWRGDVDEVTGLRGDTQ